MDVLYAIAGVVDRFMQSTPDLPEVLLYLAPAGIVGVLLHELGHAFAANDRLGIDVEVSVGSFGEIAQLKLGQVTASVNVWGQLGAVAGVAEFDDSRATARDILWIALAGPLVSFVALVLTVIVLAGIPPTGIVYGFLTQFLIVNLLGTLNVVPFAFKERRKGPAMRSDGRLALDALKVVRELR